MSASSLPSIERANPERGLTCRINLRGKPYTPGGQTLLFSRAMSPYVHMCDRNTSMVCALVDKKKIRFFLLGNLNLIRGE